MPNALQSPPSEAGARRQLESIEIGVNMNRRRKKLPARQQLLHLVGLRMRPQEYLALKREAEEHELDLQNYLRMLLKTHQHRKGRK